MSTRNEMLHRRHDGELDEQARAEPFTPDVEDRARLDALTDLSAAVRGAVTAANQAATSQPIDVWSAIASRLPATVPTSAKALTPVAHLATFRSRIKRSLYVVVPALAAAAAAVVIFFGSAAHQVSNACDIEVLDVRGASAAVINVADHEGQGSTTVIWTTPED